VSFLEALRRHWPEYAIEAVALGCFMVSAVSVTALVAHPDSPFSPLLSHPLARRFTIGIAMGATAALLIHSSLGKRSGAHMNPAVTLAFWRLGRIRGVDAACYAIAQSIGAVAGVGLAAAVIGDAARDPEVALAITVPASRDFSGVAIALASEFAISFAMMLLVLLAAHHARFKERVGLVAGALVCLYVTVEAPLSGMSMNPARSLGSAIVALDPIALESLWIYFAAPPAAMLLSTLVFERLAPTAGALCAKLDHGGAERCIFDCRYDASLLMGARERSS
jgi:aquaporin Z